MNPEKPGKPMPANIAMRNIAVMIGADFHMPRNALISRVCRRS